MISDSDRSEGRRLDAMDGLVPPVTRIPYDPDPLSVREPEPRRMTIREQLRRANPQVDGPTYRYVKGEIDEAEYRRLIESWPRTWIVPPRPRFHARHVVFVALIGFLLGVVIRGMVG